MKNEALPKGWRRVKLEELCEKTLGGGTPSTANTDYWKGCIPWMTSADIVNAKTIKPRKYITAKAVADSATNLIPKNNIIVVTRVGLGKAVKNEMDICISQDSQGLILKKSVSPDFLIHSLIEKIKVFKLTSQGSTIQGITKKRLLDLEIPLPPLYEQKAIASLLETWDTAIEKTEVLIAAKEKQFKWLLKTLISDQQDNHRWRKVKLGRFGTFYKGRGITKADLVECGIPCLRYAEIYTKYDGIVNELSSSVSPDAATKATPIQSGDIIFAASGETAAEIGKAIAFIGHYPAVAGGDTIIFRDHEQEPAYLAHALSDVDAARQKARLGKGQSVVHIHVPELFQIEVPLPPLHEQRKIVKILATWNTAIEKTKALAEQYRTQKRGLIQKLLTGKWRIVKQNSK